MDKRPICCECWQRMNCIKNGEEVVYSLIAKQSGDRYQCPVCKREIVTGLSNPYTEKDTIEYSERTGGKNENSKD